jgi:hypothetical protein
MLLGSMENMETVSMWFVILTESERKNAVTVYSIAPRKCKTRLLSDQAIYSLNARVSVTYTTNPINITNFESA